MKVEREEGFMKINTSSLLFYTRLTSLLNNTPNFLLTDAIISSLNA